MDTSDGRWANVALRRAVKVRCFAILVNVLGSRVWRCCTKGKMALHWWLAQVISLRAPWTSYSHDPECGKDSDSQSNPGQNTSIIVMSRREECLWNVRALNPDLSYQEIRSSRQKWRHGRNPPSAQGGIAWLDFVPKKIHDSWAYVEALKWFRSANGLTSSCNRRTSILLYGLDHSCTKKRRKRISPK